MPIYILTNEQAYKPGSVYGSHLSGNGVAAVLVRHTKSGAGNPRPGLHKGTLPAFFGLAPSGVYRACPVAAAAVGSYPTFPPLPSHLRSRRFISVALSLESPPPGVTRRSALWSPDFPHTYTVELQNESIACTRVHVRGCPAHSLSTIISKKP